MKKEKQPKYDVPIQVGVTEAVSLLLAKIAARKQCSVASIAREAINEYVAKEKP